MLDGIHRFQQYKRLNPNELSTKQFLDLEKEIRGQKSNVISDEYVDFKLWLLGLPSRQESFAKFIAKKLPKNSEIKILEVGCGRTGKMSRILSEQGFCITGIDPKVEVLSDDKVTFIKEEFDYIKFDISVYDYVIAQEPCDATEHVVRACVNSKVPFIMSLCGVPHKLISGSMPKDFEEWYEYLLSISKEELKLRYLNLDPLTVIPILKSNF